MSRRRGWDEFRCVDCSVNTCGIDEYYMVRDSVWRAARMKPAGGMLCIGCLEKRLGRMLCPGDFTSCSLNREPQQSERLQRRIWNSQLELALAGGGCTHERRL